MPLNAGKEWTFNTVADTYEKIRPSYPVELYRTPFDYAPLDASSSAVEIGIGGGQAAPPVLETGCALTAVEYGDKLAQVCREKFSNYPKFSVITGKFEDAALPDGAFDLVYSASAFHWVPEELGYPKVFRVLKSGGSVRTVRQPSVPGKGQSRSFPGYPALLRGILLSLLPQNAGDAA